MSKPDRLGYSTVGIEHIRQFHLATDKFLDDNETLEPSDYKKANADIKVDRGHMAPLASFANTIFWRMKVATRAF